MENISLSLTEFLLAIFTGIATIIFTIIAFLGRRTISQNDLRVVQLEKSCKELDEKNDAHVAELAAYKLEVANNYVRNGDLKSFEERIEKLINAVFTKLDKIQDSLANKADRSDKP